MKIKNKKFKANLPKPNVSPMADYKKNPGSLNSAAFAAHFKAKQLKSDIVVIEGNSYMNRVYHLATPDEDLSKFTGRGDKRANVLVVTPKGEAYEAIAESKSTTFKEFYLAEAAPGSEEDFRNRFPKVADHFKDVKDIKELRKLKKAAIKKVDANEDGWKDGPIEFFFKKWSAEFKKNDMGPSRSRGDARADMILRTRDSKGRATARKFS